MNFTKLSSTFLLGVLVISMGVVGCKKKDVVPNEPDPGVPGVSQNELYSGVTITASIGGQVRDEANNPIENALITIGNNTTYTNGSGFFYLTGISVDSDRAYVKVEKNGYFSSGRAVNPNENGISYASIQLLSKTAVGVVDNGTGGTVNISGGATLTFETGDVGLENGNAYNGQVTVYASYLDPTAPNIGEIAPGDLDAIDANGDVVSLITYGMVAVELVGSNGEALNVAPGQTVEISMPFQTAQQGGAPASMPLWYFDEQAGNWVEEGIATLQGNNYVGEVSHFSFWNCDDPTTPVNLTLTVTCNGTPSANVAVTLFSPSGVQYGTCYTDAYGQIDELMPSGVATMLEIYDVCGVAMYSQSLGINNSDVDLGTISACSSSNTSAFSATLLDCNGAPVSSGMITVQVGSTVIPFFTDANGYVNSSITTCTASNVTIAGFDFNQVLQITPTSVPVTPVMDSGNLTVCDQIDEFVLYTYDGVDYAINDLGQNEVYANSSFMNSLGMMAYINSTYNISFFTEDLGLGTHPNIAVPGLPSGIGLQVNGVQADPNTISVTYTQYGSAPGDYYEGTFSGSYNDTLGNPHTLSGSFRMK